jgi:hypothetical protein
VAGPPTFPGSGATSFPAPAQMHNPGSATGGVIPVPTATQSHHAPACGGCDRATCTGGCGDDAIDVLGSCEGCHPRGGAGGVGSAQMHNPGSATGGVIPVPTATQSHHAMPPQAAPPTTMPDSCAGAGKLVAPEPGKVGGPACGGCDRATCTGGCGDCQRRRSLITPCHLRPLRRRLCPIPVREFKSRPHTSLQNREKSAALPAAVATGRPALVDAEMMR